MAENSSGILALLEALDDEAVIKKFQSVLKPLLVPIQDSLQQVMDQNASLKRQLADRDATIDKLNQEVDALKITIDDLEQHGRKGSIRVFGLPEDTPGQVDEKIVTLVNEHLKVRPPIALEYVEVAHRLGKPPEQTVVLESDQAASQTRPTSRAVIVRFASRRTKSRVMKEKKNLKTNPFMRANGTPASVYLTDDLTKRRAQLAYQARQLKREGKLSDTWVCDARIYIKDNHNHVSQINVAADFRKFA